MERAIGLLGIGVLLLLAWLASTNRRVIRWIPILIALASSLFPIRGMDWSSPCISCWARWTTRAERIRVR